MGRILVSKAFFSTYWMVWQIGILPRRIQGLIRAFHNGFWLGVLPNRLGHRITEQWYSGRNRYHEDDANLRGLYPEEVAMVDRHFSGIETVLVGGAGGGREMLELHGRGLRVTGFECNEALREYGNDFLKRNDAEPSIRPAERNRSLAEDGVKYDGILIGWGVYIHMIGRATRLRFLSEIRTQLSDEGVLILGFCHRSADSRFFKIVGWLAAPVRCLLYSERVELGDKLEPTLEHHFTVGEIVSEGKEAGMACVDVDHTNPGRALAVFRKEPQ